MISNLLPLFLFNVLGVRTSVIGLIEGVAETTASLLKVFSGWLSDRLGKRKGLAVLGYGLSTVAKPFLYFATTWGWVLGVRFADRAGKGLRTAPRDALVADSVDEKQRGLAFGLHRAGRYRRRLHRPAGRRWSSCWPRSAARRWSASTFQLIVLLSLVPALAGCARAGTGGAGGEAAGEGGREPRLVAGRLRSALPRSSWSSSFCSPWATPRTPS